MDIKIGIQISPQHGDLPTMRKRWLEAEALGVDALYSNDHFHAGKVPEKFAQGEHHELPAVVNGLNFEATSLQAAMAATTTRPEIGCLVHAIGYRNPNLLADIARTIDHISGGRFILGVGTGYLEQDYLEYGYAYGTAQSRVEDLAKALPIIKERFKKLNPAPLRKIPILIATMGEKVGMRIVAEHADMWHVYGTTEKVARKVEVLKELCKEIGRDFSEIELTTYYFPHMLQMEQNPDDFLELGIRNIITVQQGPDWDLGILKELLAWRDARRKHSRQGDDSDQTEQNRGASDEKTAPIAGSRMNSGGDGGT